jgi:hypothetical protein
MVTYKVELPRRTGSTHIGTNKDPELFEHDRRLLDKHLFKSGTPKWRKPDNPSTQCKMKVTWLHGAAYVSHCVQRAMRRKKARGRDER